MKAHTFSSRKCLNSNSSKELDPRWMLLTSGSYFIKRKSRLCSIIHERFIWCSDDLTLIMWGKPDVGKLPKAKRPDPYVHMAMKFERTCDILSVTSGRLKAKKSDADADADANNDAALALIRIIFVSRRFQLETKDFNKQQQWIKALKWLKIRLQKERLEKSIAPYQLNINDPDQSFQWSNYFQALEEEKKGHSLDDKAMN